MAVIQVQGRSPLSTLGGIASLGGMFIPGAQWLTPLGMGLGTVDGILNGNGNGNNGQIIFDPPGSWGNYSNPAKGNIAKSKDKQVLDTLRRELGTQSQYNNDYKVRSGK